MINFHKSVKFHNAPNHEFVKQLRHFTNYKNQLKLKIELTDEPRCSLQHENILNGNNVYKHIFETKFLISILDNAWFRAGGLIWELENLPIERSSLKRKNKILTVAPSGKTALKLVVTIKLETL